MGAGFVQRQSPARLRPCCPLWVPRSRTAKAKPRWMAARRGGSTYEPATADEATIAGLGTKMERYSMEEQVLYEMLIDAGQGHLFDTWEASGIRDEQKHAFFQQVANLDQSYPGGLPAYINRARTLLAAAVAQRNPFEGMEPSVPDGEIFHFNTPDFVRAQERGLKEAARSAFVLVAGGLGERLGYSGIKLALPVETTTGSTYLEFYVKYLMALQEKSGRAVGRTDVRIPLVIMTSDDTDAKTRELLAQNNNFGMDKGQIMIVKQDKVPALKDAEAHLAAVDGDPYTLDTKPHGHGDVHHLLQRHGLAKRWVQEGRKWLFFMQDTNALVVNSVLPALAVSATKEYHMNSICVPRKAGEASGAITRLTDTITGRHMIINVEYNQLDPLLRATTYPEGDVNDPSTGNSPFPGNANNIVFELESYNAVLQGEDQGMVSEFVNPKFKDKSRMSFTKPTRLECMMQDFPKLLAKELGPQARVGFTSFEKWLSFSPAKNSLEAGAKSATSGVPPATTSSAEMELYACYAKLLRTAGAYVEDGATEMISNIPLQTGPRILLSPSFALTGRELREKLVSPENIRISGRSTLVIDGEDVVVDGLHLDGTLVVRAAKGVSVLVRDCGIQNDGWGLEKLAPGESVREEEGIRGYRMRRTGGLIVDIKEPGQYVLTGSGHVLKA